MSYMVSHRDLIHLVIHPILDSRVPGAFWLGITSEDREESKPVVGSQGITEYDGNCPETQIIVMNLKMLIFIFNRNMIES